MIVKVINFIVEITKVIRLVWSAKTEFEADIWVIDLEYEDSGTAGTDKPQIRSLEAIINFFDWGIACSSSVRVPPEASCRVLTDD